MWLIVASGTAVVAWFSQSYLGLASYYRPELDAAPSFRGDALVRGWIRWDAEWYAQIAAEGYSYDVDRPSSVAFFPLYPLLMRGLGALSLDIYLAGILITLASGFAVVVLFSRWCRSHLARQEAWTALLCLVLYPYAFYFYGAVYADTLFVALALAAFVALERRHPLLAGSFGFLAALTRPVGVALLVGLALVLLEQRGVVGRHADRTTPFRNRLHRLRPADAGVLLPGVGLLAYVVYLGSRFGEPMAFARAQSAAGWKLDPGPATWFKIRIWDLLTGAAVEPPGFLPGALVQGAIGLACLAAVPAVVRRFGWGYGAYVAIVVGFSVISLKDFQGLGRHVPAAFPVFGVWGAWLTPRPSRAVLLTASAMAMVALTSFYARGYYVA